MNRSGNRLLNVSRRNLPLALAAGTVAAITAGVEIYANRVGAPMNELDEQTALDLDGYCFRIAGKRNRRIAI